MMVNVREASVTNHAFLERMFVEAALWDPGLGDIAIAKYEPGIIRSIKPGRGSTTEV